MVHVATRLQPYIYIDCITYNINLTNKLQLYLIFESLLDADVWCAVHAWAAKVR